MSSWTAGRVAEVAGATCEGDDSLRITGVASLEEAGPGELSFSTAPGGALERTRAGAVLLAEGSTPRGTVALRCPDPRLGFARAAQAMFPVSWPEPGVHPTAVVSPEARVEGAAVGPYCVVEAGAVLGEGTWLVAHVYIGAQVRTGRRCRLLPHSVVLERCTLGERVTLHPGAVVGSDGFGFATGVEGPVRVPHLGTVELGDGVEVGAGAAVDRAALGATRLGAGTALDNLVMIAHGVHTGEGCLLVAYSGAAGSARLGDGVQLGARAGVREGVSVGDGARLAGGTAATVDVAAGATIAGVPAVPYARWLQELAAVRRLPQLLARVRELERRLGEAPEEGGLIDPTALPQQPPFRLVDRVLEVEPGERCVAAYDVPEDASWVEAHFPDNPLMPGVLVAEALAQTAGLAYLAAHPEGLGRPMLMVGWDGLRFRGPVRPRDTLVLEARALRRTRILWKFECAARVGGAVVVDGVLLGTLGRL